MKKNIRILLITPIQFNEIDKGIKEKIVIKTNEIENDSEIFEPSKWSFLDNVTNTYTDKSFDAFSLSETINNERNLDLFLYNDFSEQVTFTYDNISITLNAQLLSDENCNFFITYDYLCTSESIKDSDTFINDILKNKDIFTNTNTNDFWQQTTQKATLVLKSTLKKLNIKNYTELSYKITKDSSYPIIYLNGYSLNDNKSIFFNEENYSQRIYESPICKDYKDSYLHIGWNYAVISNLPKNLNSKLFSSIIVLQLHYYQIRFYKKNFQKKIQNIASINEFSENDLNSFDKLKIAYYKQYLDYRTYRSGLYPKLYDEFKEVESLWHIHEDIEFIDKILDVQNEYIVKKFQQSTEKFNLSLNRALALIAFIQIATIYGIFKDYYELEKIFPYEHLIATYVLFSTTAIAILLISSSKIKSMFKKLF